MYTLQYKTCWVDGDSFWQNVFMSPKIENTMLSILENHKQHHFKKRQKSDRFIENHKYRIIKYSVIKEF